MINLYKKSYTYKNKDGEEVNGTRFYLKCGDTLIPIEVTYFDKKDEKGNSLGDSNFKSRKAVLSSYAEILPDKE
ncbi:MAG: hypothetical protein E7358_06640 [Clostridiales bacterium]|nr:hypothetical protein [Clostridiales bacterium]